MMKFLKKCEASADMNMQWVMWAAILFAIVVALIVFKDQVIGFVTQSGTEVDNMTNAITGNTSGL